MWNPFIKVFRYAVIKAALILLHIQVGIIQPFPPKLHLKAPVYELLAWKISVLKGVIKLKAVSETSYFFCALFPEYHQAAFPVPGFTNYLRENKP